MNHKLDLAFAKSEISLITPADRRVLTTLAPEDRALTIKLLLEYPTLTAAEAVEHLRAAGGI